MERKSILRRRPLHIQDTPIKTKLIKHKNNYRRPLAEKINIYQPLLEESGFEETEVPTAQGSLNNVEPVQCNVLHLRGVCCSQLNVKSLCQSSTTLANTNRDASPPRMPTRNSPMTPAPSNTFGNLGHFDDPIVLEAALEAGSTSSGREYGTSISYNVSDGSSSPVSSTCTSILLSPEVFRSACDEGTPSVCALRPLDFSIEEELLHPKVKNSTLLDVSNANNVQMEQPLDLSLITGTKVESRRGCKHFVSDWNFKKISPKKKVHFQRPANDVILRPMDACGVVQKRSRRPGQDTPRIFNFTCLEDRDAYFQKLRDRYARLKSVPLFIQTTNNGVPS